MAEVQGHHDPAFSPLSTLLKSFIQSGEELGASICVNHNGRDIVDIWGGYTDLSRTKPWTHDTITNVWSTTKTVTSLAALILVERGQLDLEAPVSKYWPEFAQNGKEGVKVKHIISHTSGVSGWEEKLTWQDVCDVEKATAMLAKQKLWWEPGTKSGYQAINMGHLVGEVVKRVSGLPMKQFVEKEIAGPLGADFQIGCKESDWHRISNVIPPPPPPKGVKVDRQSVMYKTFANPFIDARISHTPVWRHSDLGAANGHGNARSVARMLSPVSMGGTVPGLSEPLLSNKTIDRIFEVQAHGQDLVTMLQHRFGIGFGLPAPGTSLDWLPEGRICFWSGWGGSIVIMDVDRKLTIAYVMNKMEGGNPTAPWGNRTIAYVQTVYRCLGVALPPQATMAKL